MSFQNFYATRTSTDIGSGDTTITVDAAPTATSGRVVLEARNPTQREIVSYSGVSGNQLTGVVRGLGGTTAKTHIKGALVEMNLTAEDIVDLYNAFDTFSASNNDWRTAVTTASLIAYNGQGSYTMTVADDLTGFISPGMRIRTTRTAAAPTRSTSLNGTTQYWAKTSPNKLTFTDDFVASAWIKLSSYGSGFPTIVSRYNGTNGWWFIILPTGQVELTGFNGGGGNFSRVQSIQSIPLNRWVHVAAQLDMSAFTATSTTSYVMIDGVDVPAAVARGGTNPTALIQAGNLEVGSNNGGTNPLSGKVAQVAVFNSKVTQATIRGYISKGLSGSETSLASAYSFDNSTNDLNTTTPNNLVAGGGSPTATNADSPFGNQADGSISSTLDYGIVHAIDAMTITIQTPEGCTIPTAGGISALHYSGVKSPYGFPSKKGKWILQAVSRVSASQSSPTSGTWYNIKSFNITLPIGSWVLGQEGTIYASKAASTAVNVQRTLSTTTNSETTPDLTVSGQSEGASGQMTVLMHTSRQAPIDTATATVYYLNTRTNVASANSIGDQAGSSGFNSTKITAENAYL